MKNLLCVGCLPNALQLFSYLILTAAPGKGFYPYHSFSPYDDTMT